MTDGEIVEFLSAGSKVLQVATIGNDGMPHLAAMWYVMVAGRIVFRSFTKSQKIVNLIRDPRLSVLTEEGETYATLVGLSIQADAQLVTDPDYIVEIYRKLAAKYPYFRDESSEISTEAAEEEFGRFASKNTAVTVNPISVASWDHRKLGGQ